jgi:hypothetical protein
LKEKLQSIERAMKYLSDNALEPKLIDDHAESAEDSAASQNNAVGQPLQVE